MSNLRLTKSERILLESAVSSAIDNEEAAVDSFMQEKLSDDGRTWIREPHPANRATVNRSRRLIEKWKALLIKIQGAQ